MKTAELVKLLQEADPGGEMEVRIGELDGGPERSMLVTTRSALVGRELRDGRVVLSPVEDATADEDVLREALGAREHETEVEAARRVVAERDHARAAVRPSRCQYFKGRCQAGGACNGCEMAHNIRGEIPCKNHGYSGCSPC